MASLTKLIGNLSNLLDRQNRRCKLVQNLIKQIIDWSLFAVTIIYLLTGLGITEYRIIEPMTFGLLGKSLSLEIHENLLRPFLVLLSLHLIYKPISWIYSRRRRRALRTTSKGCMHASQTRVELKKNSCARGVELKEDAKLHACFSSEK